MQFLRFLRASSYLVFVFPLGLIAQNEEPGVSSAESSVYQPESVDYSEIKLSDYFPRGGYLDPAGWRGAFNFGPYQVTKYIYAHQDDPIDVDDVLYVHNKAFSNNGSAGRLFQGATTFLVEIPAGRTLRVALYNHGGSYGCSGSLRLYSTPLPGVVLPVGTRPQQVFFALPESMVFGGVYTLRATATSRLPISFEVSDPTSAIVENGNKLRILSIKPRGFFVTARQKGNTEWRGKVVHRLAKPSKRPQSISLTLPRRVALETTFEISATINSPLPISVVSNNQNVVRIEHENGRFLGIAVGKGRAVIKARQQGNENYAAAVPTIKTVLVR